MTNVGAIRMVINPGNAPSRDLIIDGIYTTTSQTPEPGTLLLFGTGLLSVIGYGWRRHNKVAEHTTDSDTAR
jgi:hypothetical protein